MNPLNDMIWTEEVNEKSRMVSEGIDKDMMPACMICSCQTTSRHDGSITADDAVSPFDYGEYC